MTPSSPEHEDAELTRALLDDALHRICDEQIPRVLQCLDRLTPGQIWERPNPELVSVGNLVLHLEGNARQWLLHALCGQPDTRQRDREFATVGPLSTEALVSLLRTLDVELRAALPRLDTRALLAVYPVQVFRETGVAVLLHAVEHFSYHTGQIARETKRFTVQDLGFYAGLDLQG